MNRTKHIVLSLLALLCWLTAAAQVSVTKCEYWFDQQFDSRMTADVSEGTWSKDLDISALNYGLHSIAIRVLTIDGEKSLYSPVVVKNFIKLEATPTGTNSLTTYEYWIDQKFDARKSGTINASGIVNFDEDLSALDYGLHNVTIRVIDATGKVSSALVKNFMKLETTPTGSNSLKTYEYWIDQKFDERKSGIVPETGIVEFDYDLSTLNVGLHNISMRVIDATDKVSSVMVKNFMKVQQLEGENALTTYEYWIDKDEHQSAEVPADGIVNLDLDISSLHQGLHTFNYMTRDKAGVASAVTVKQFFVKKGVMEANLVGIDYWFNDGPRTRIAIDPAQQAIDKDDVVIPLDGLQPRAIPEDYVFDATTKKVNMTENVTVGIQVFNNEEVGSEAHVETLENMPFAVDPQFVALADGEISTKTAPKGGQIQGFSYAGAVDAELHWAITGTVVKADFFDADGKPVTTEKKTVDGKDVLVMKMPTANVYLLAYGATEDGEVSVKAKILILGDANQDGLVNVTDIVATVNYIMENPSGTFDKVAADVNKDGFINVSDIVAMVNIIMTSGSRMDQQEVMAILRRCGFIFKGEE